MLSVQCQQWRRTLETVQQERAKEKLENKQLLEIKVQYVCMATSLLVEIWGGGGKGPCSSLVLRSALSGAMVLFLIPKGRVEILDARVAT